MTTLLALLANFVAGALTWTFLEWLLHGQLFHTRKLRNSFAKEHALHHADPTHMVGWPRKLLGVAFVIGVGVAVLRLALGDFEAATAFPVGLGLMYVVYESVHRIIHMKAPRTAYGRWLRLQHVQHHFHTPRRNFGVTSTVWDHVFGTYVPFTTPLAVPRRLAMPWLLDPETGELADAYVDDYVLVRRTRDVPESAVPA
ncbi:sterol desaturase family protein [Herbidospora mongoliensis]|uniref:sterol desaturase family protein n=1 Tax=Herbidospora mongoliensis TaxID=688067 RepID=UPI000833C7BA|nr:sterol desaturase family protein [Herbidospora mongoliensis]